MGYATSARIFLPYPKTESLLSKIDLTPLPKARNLELTPSLKVRLVHMYTLFNFFKFILIEDVVTVDQVGKVLQMNR